MKSLQTYLSLSLLVIASSLQAAPDVMVPILPPELPKAQSLQESLSKPSPLSQQRKASFSLEGPNTPAYSDLRQDDLHQDYLTPQWELFRWKSSDGNP
ncbi:MAG: hypothetical protein HON68_09160 [Gammaproteobacteria bacterium]|nr:hypothetical protein [Gammaproteobacteria bacterium]MBT3490035.1 hypothetical protein [Gammaproteobacteria bacterium]MBT3719509.1 hypothetical protein [Gammaproteobacteria bacterium]MBT3845963.1 hypothetical protein [Gammaproteobacteria bacterium]MBT3892926.1 hypothetical protein [Gammaproteobacteria bacterium]